MTKTKEAVVVYGATGHTGRFVVAELLERDLTPILSGRDAAKLEAAAGGLAVRPATVDDPASLDRALAGAAAVVNAAGPFAATARPVLEAALRARVPYVDTAAELEVLASTFADYPHAETPVVPAMAFYGGLGDLLVTAAMGEWTAADEVRVAYGLSSWHPTPGTRAAGRVSSERRGGRRARVVNGELEYYDGELPEQDWPFPEPLGHRRVIAEFTMADAVTVPSHLTVPKVTTYMTIEAAADLADEQTPPPKPADRKGRSDQTFVVDVVIQRNKTERRATATGRDIYAISAPLAVEAVQRILAGETQRPGVASAGAMFDAPDFLGKLAPYLSYEKLPRTG